MKCCGTLLDPACIDLDLDKRLGLDVLGKLVCMAVLHNMTKPHLANCMHCMSWLATALSLCSCICDKMLFNTLLQYSYDWHVHQLTSPVMLQAVHCKPRYLEAVPCCTRPCTCCKNLLSSRMQPAVHPWAAHCLQSTQHGKAHSLSFQSVLALFAVLFWSPLQQDLAHYTPLNCKLLRSTRDTDGGAASGSMLIITYCPQYTKS